MKSLLIIVGELQLINRSFQWCIEFIIMRNSTHNTLVVFSDEAVVLNSSETYISIAIYQMPYNVIEVFLFVLLLKGGKFGSLSK